jgi:putative membrane protein
MSRLQNLETRILAFKKSKFTSREIRMRQFAAALVLLCPLVAFSAEIPDAKFYRDAAEGGMAEVEMGNLAQQKAQSPSVKDFGAQMVKDHAAANKKLKTLALSKNITLPAGPSVAELTAKSKLQSLSGQAFDKSYVRGMIKDHEEDIAEFKKEAASGQDPDARAFATAILPMLEEHLKKIEAIAADTGVSTD